MFTPAFPSRSSISLKQDSMPVAFRGREASPERSKLTAKAAVVYYLSRNGQLDHPHFMEVPLSSPVSGIYLRDVISRFCSLRGQAMVGAYSWSSKRSYKNGYVWHDLSVNDLVHPVHGNEYVLKGTPLFRLAASTSRSFEMPSQYDILAPSVRRKHTAAKNETSVKSTDASTQTDDLRTNHRRSPVVEDLDKRSDNPASELGRDEISLPPPSSSSPEILESLIKANRRRIAAAAQGDDEGRMVDRCLSGRLRASAVLMHVISCGSIAVKASGFSLMPQYRGGLDRVESMGRVQSFRGVRWMEEELFSGRLAESDKIGGDEKGAEMPCLKKAASRNAVRLVSFCS